MNQLAPAPVAGDTDAAPCPLCGRPMPPGTFSKHHLVPRSRGGRVTARLHKVCHSKIHSVFDNKELAKKYNSAEALLEHPEIQKFVAWVRSKDPSFYDRGRLRYEKSKLSRRRRRGGR